MKYRGHIEFDFEFDVPGDDPTDDVQTRNVETAGAAAEVIGTTATVMGDSVVNRFDQDAMKITFNGGPVSE